MKLKICAYFRGLNAGHLVQDGGVFEEAGMPRIWCFFEGGAYSSGHLIEALHHYISSLVYLSIQEISTENGCWAVKNLQSILAVNE